MVTATDTLKTGSTLTGKRQYTITKVLGQGGFGITYKAVSEFRDGNISHEAYYAIKEFYPQEICTRQSNGTVECKAEHFKDQFKSQKEEFYSEAKLLRDVCKHKNIVSVNEVIEANGTIYYVMQCVNGDTLAQYVTKGGTIKDTDNITTIIAAIGDGLEFLHSHKIAHLDIKPDNIILPPTGVPTIIDFGLARHYNKRNKLTHHHAFIGCSDGYSPVEQYLGIETFSPKTDTYALATTMLFMLTGIQPPKAPGLKAEYIHAQLDNKCPDNIIEALIAATNNDISQRCDLATFLAALQIKHPQAKEPERGKHTQIIGYTPNKKNWFKHTPIIAIIMLLLIIAGGAIGYKSCTGGTRGEDTTATVTDTIDTTTTNAIDTVETKKDTIEINEDTIKTDTIILPVPPPNPVPPKPDGPYTWTGKYRNGKPDGEGTLTFKRDCTISGFHFKAGDKFKGTMNEGQIYSGDWYDASGNIKQENIFGGN